jgi:hypothetical protein
MNFEQLQPRTSIIAIEITRVLLVSFRHGSVFEWRGQWYFACNDRTHGGSPYFRNTVRHHAKRNNTSHVTRHTSHVTRHTSPRQVIGYVHYRANGTIAPVRITSAGCRCRASLLRPPNKLSLMMNAGVGEHDIAVSRGRLPAAEYDAVSNGNKTENAFGGQLKHPFSTHDSNS